MFGPLFVAMVIDFFSPVIVLWNRIFRRKKTLKEGSNCPVCSDGILQRNVKQHIFRYRDRSLVVDNYITYDCPKCKEGFNDAKQWASLVPKINAMMRGKN